MKFALLSALVAASAGAAAATTVQQYIDDRANGVNQFYELLSTDTQNSLAFATPEHFVFAVLNETDISTLITSASAADYHVAPVNNGTQFEDSTFLNSTIGDNIIINSVTEEGQTSLFVNGQRIEQAVTDLTTGRVYKIAQPIAPSNLSLVELLNSEAFPSANYSLARALFNETTVSQLLTSLQDGNGQITRPFTTFIPTDAALQNAMQVLPLNTEADVLSLLKLQTVPDLALFRAVIYAHANVTVLSGQLLIVQSSSEDEVFRIYEQGSDSARASPLVNFDNTFDLGVLIGQEGVVGQEQLNPLNPGASGNASVLSLSLLSFVSVSLAFFLCF